MCKILRHRRIPAAIGTKQKFNLEVTKDRLGRKTAAPKYIGNITVIPWEHLA